ncbi:MAG: polysaccharide deacetylase family protein [Clostridiales bacterium]|nr:polysaccharide deacetylase family protein [Clostridiales bacterium]
MIKKVLSIFLAGAVCLCGTGSFYAEESGSETAVKVDIKSYNEAGATVYEITGYEINDRLCIAPQNLSYILKDTECSFALISDFENMTVRVDKNGGYIGEEPYLNDGDNNPVYTVSDLTYIVGEESCNIPSYTIDGVVYSEIRSLAEPLGYDLEWNPIYKSVTFTETDKTEAIALIYTSKAVFSVSGKPVCFTFDDGPTPENTDRLLAALSAVDGHATFFVVGERVGTYPELVKHIYEQDSQIGNHSYSHATLTYLGADGVRSQIYKTSNAVYDAAGVYPYIGRAPGGAINAAVKSAVNIEWFNWNVDTNDWRYRDSDYIYNYVLNNIKEGDVILMHDLYKTTVTAVERLLPVLKEQGYCFVTIDEMAQLKGGYENIPGHM